MNDRIIDFSGRTWRVRSGFGGPGPNNWSPKCVWLDGEGRLHIAVKKIGEKWFCGQVATMESLGYGEYRWYLEGRVDNLDENVVGGLFTYLNDETEIDIEFAKIFSTNGDNLNYTVQPFDVSGNIFRQFFKQTSEQTTHRFIWTKESIVFQSWYGHTPQPEEGALIAEWMYTGDHNPEEDRERLYMNIWLYQGSEPWATDCLEMVIKEFFFSAR